MRNSVSLRFVSKSSGRSVRSVRICGGLGNAMILPKNVAGGSHSCKGEPRNFLQAVHVLEGCSERHISRLWRRHDMSSRPRCATTRKLLAEPIVRSLQLARDQSMARRVSGEGNISAAAAEQLRECFGMSRGHDGSA